MHKKKAKEATTKKLLDLGLEIATIPGTTELPEEEIFNLKEKEN